MICKLQYPLSDGIDIDINASEERPLQFFNEYGTLFTLSRDEAQCLLRLFREREADIITILEHVQVD